MLRATAWLAAVGLKPVYVCKLVGRPFYLQFRWGALPWGWGVSTQFGNPHPGGLVGSSSATQGVAGCHQRDSCAAGGRKSAATTPPKPDTPSALSSLRSWIVMFTKVSAAGVTILSQRLLF